MTICGQTLFGKYDNLGRICVLCAMKILSRYEMHLLLIFLAWMLFPADMLQLFRHRISHFIGLLQKIAQNDRWCLAIASILIGPDWES